MDREFEQAIGRVKTQHFTLIAEQERCKRVRQVLDAHMAQGDSAASKPAIKKLAREIRGSMDSGGKSGAAPVLRFGLGTGENHTSQRPGR